MALSVADRDELEHGFRRLSPELRAVIVLHHYLGYPLTEIAATLGIPVRVPVNPYGFIAKNQALPGDLTKPAPLASAIVDVLVKHPRIAERMRESLVVAMEQAQSYVAARTVVTKIEGCTSVTPSQLDRLASAISTNREVGYGFGVPTRMQKVVERKPRV